MAQIDCDNDECTWCIGRECQAGWISIDADRECENYTDITETLEYKNLFWKRCGQCNGP